jgi:hypothetical protein
MGISSAWMPEYHESMPRISSIFPSFQVFLMGIAFGIDNLPLYYQKRYIIVIQIYVPRGKDHGIEG